MAKITFQDCVVIHFPWGGRGELAVRRYDADGKVVFSGMSRTVDNEAECAIAHYEAREEAHMLAGEAGYYELAEPQGCSRTVMQAAVASRGL